MTSWKVQIEQLRIPYPRKVELLHELEDHVRHFPSENAESLEAADLSELYLLHNNWMLRSLDGVPLVVRQVFELSFSGAPLAGFLIYLSKESFMLEFIREGGVGMYVILAIGFALFGREALLMSRVLILKDHSKANLNLDTQAVLVGSLALMFLGICVTGAGFYKTGSYVEMKNLPASVLLVGLRESVTAVIVSSSLAALVLLSHFFTRRMLAYWKAPLSS